MTAPDGEHDDEDPCPPPRDHVGKEGRADTGGAARNCAGSAGSE